MRSSLSTRPIPRCQFWCKRCSACRHHPRRAFNTGVEAGQLAVIAVAFLLVGWWSATKDWYRQRMVIPASLGIAGIALYLGVRAACAG